MNRIILIGNGFDLAHGLPTGYVDFINHYWEDFGYHVLNGYARLLLEQYGTANIKSYADNFASLQRIDKKSTNIKKLPVCNNGQNEYNGLCKFINDYNQAERFTDAIQLEFNNLLFEHISTQCSLENWVDIENEYYQLLSKTYHGKNSQYETAEDLNSELNVIKERLIEYLRKIQDEKITNDIVNDQIKKIIFEPIDTNDISVSGQSLFLQFLNNRLDDLSDTKTAASLFSKYKLSSEKWQDIHEYINTLLTYKDEKYGIFQGEIYMRNSFSVSDREVFNLCLLPDEVLFLNFNYTQTAKLYIPDHNDFKLNHIHGELSNPNSVIFGYGDEMNEDYKKIVDLNNKGYLENIKSIRYLETDNYRNLLSFIDSAPFQIYIMGHSCGNSDRTLLNALFEHKNCISIKPYYHQKEDGTDNYIDIIQNIYRDFKDMSLMRDRVVNKRYCQPLIAH